MASSSCPNCGAPIPPGSRFCNYCGSSLLSSGSPLPSASAPSSGGPPPLSFGPTGPPPFPAPGAPVPGFAAGPPPAHRRRHHTLLIAIVLVVVIIIVVAVVVSLLVPAPPNVEVNYIVVFAPDGVCGLNPLNDSYYGFGNVSAGSTQQFSLPFNNTTPSSCTIHGVATNSSGFSVSATPLPLSVGGPGDNSSSISLTVVVPSHAYNGNLNLIFS